MLDFTDVIGGPLKVLLERSIASKIGLRLALTYELTLAATISFLLSCGGALAVARPALQAVGLGMFVAGLAMAGTFRISDNARGLKISLSTPPAAEQPESTTVTIERKA